jgi:hypothetical protein
LGIHAVSVHTTGLESGITLYTCLDIIKHHVIIVGLVITRHPLPKVSGRAITVVPIAPLTPDPRIKMLQNSRSAPIIADQATSFSSGQSAPVAPHPT